MPRRIRQHALLFLVTLLAVAAAAVTARAQTQTVQVTAAQARVHLSADAGSPVVTPVPVGAVLEVVSRTGNWIQVRLPRDSSGFDRVGFIQASQVRDMAAPAGPGAPAPAAEAAPRARTAAAVLDFEFGAVERWWSGNWNVGRGVADLMVEKLLQTGQLRLLERSRIQSVLAEQNLSNSDRADVTAREAATLGKVLGANVLITGSVTKFGSEERQVGGAAGSVAGRFFGGAGARNTTAEVAITVRAIDSTTSEILASVTTEGSSNRRGVLLGTAIGGNVGAINMTSSDFRETILGEATEKAVNDAATKLTAALANVLR
jgi:curli biogenesis system outer membrane secretion channel CsgG